MDWHPLGSHFKFTFGAVNFNSSYGGRKGGGEEEEPLDVCVCVCVWPWTGSTKNSMIAATVKPGFTRPAQWKLALYCNNV